MYERHTEVGGSTGPYSIGPTMKIYENDDYLVVTDCGGEPDENLVFRPPDLAYLAHKAKEGRRINAVILTHIHADHAAFMHLLVPYLAPNAKIWSTPQNFAGLKILMDEVYRFGGDEFLLPTLEITDEERQAVLKVGENEILPGLVIYVFPNGHIFGSFSIIFHYRCGKNGLITSDWCFQSTPTRDGAEFVSRAVPREWLKDLSMVMGSDCTYGEGGVRKPREQEKERFKAWIKAGLERSGKIIVPALRFGRGQDIPIDIASMGFNVPIYVDGGARRGFEIALENPWCDKDRTDFSMAGIQFIGKRAHREELLESSDPMIVVSPAGMVTGGPIGSWLAKSLPNPNHRIAFVNYQGVGTPGREILDRTGKEEASVKISTGPETNEFGESTQIEKVPIRAEVERFDFSGHCDMADSVRYFNDVMRAARQGQRFETFVLCHGTPLGKRNAYTWHHNFVVPGGTVYAKKNTVIEIK